jgi:hypothetical protein
MTRKLSLTALKKEIASLFKETPKKKKTASKKKSTTSSKKKKKKQVGG